MKGCVLFDFDGTIMDSEPAIMESYSYLFRKYRTIDAFTPQRRIQVLGPALFDMMKIFFPEQDPDQMVREYRAYQQAHLQDLIKPMKHALELLAWLKVQGIPAGVVSTRYRRSLDELLEKADMKQYLDVVIGHDDVTKEKPDPEGIIKAMHALHADQCIYAGDSVTDIQAGKRADAYTIGYISNEGKAGRILAEKPDFVTRELLDVEKVVKEELWH